MKVCKNCGVEMNDDAMYCPHCGMSISDAESRSSYRNDRTEPYGTQNGNGFQGGNPGYGYSYNQPMGGIRPNGFQTAAKVFMILSIISYVLIAVILLIVCIAAGGVAADSTSTGTGLAIGGALGVFMAICCAIPLAWIIPMYVIYKRKVRDGMPVSVAFKICTIFFVSLLAGIFMLCANDSY